MLLKVIIADDHPVVLAGIKTLLNTHMNRYQLISEAHDATSLLNALKKYDVDLVITDYSMPNSDYADGIAMIEHLRKTHPHLRIIVFTQMANPALFQALINIGVDGLLQKHSALTELSQALSHMEQNKRFFSQSVKKALGDLKVDITLTPRELEVVRLFANGFAVSQIAIKLNRSIKTISNQKKSAMARLGITSDSALFEYAKSSGLC